MKFNLILLCFFISFQTYAQSCSGLSEGEVIRVDEENKSLANFKVQDQDGLGTCYANAASLLLQGVLPGNPEISYLHLASIYKAEKLQSLREQSASSKDFEIYAKKSDSKNKAINGGGDALKWDIAMDAGNTCGTIHAVKNLESGQKKPVLCPRTEMNLEKILGSKDNEHKQFKTMLEASIYMNEFQKEFGDLNQKAGWFNKKKIAAAHEKYETFKKAFEVIIENKKNKIAEQDCKRINTDYLSPVVSPMIQTALTYRACFQSDFPSKDEFWCKSVKGIVFNPKTQSDGSIEVDGVNPEWMKKLQEKITQKDGGYSMESLRESVVDSLVEFLNPTPREKPLMQKFIGDRLVSMPELSKNLANLGSEFTEVKEKGFSPLCVKRNTYNFFETKEFEETWKNDATLCPYANLMKQAGNVIVKYKESGLEDLDAALRFLTTNAGDTYDKAIISLYAADCDDSVKISIPKALTCSSISVSDGNKNEVNSKIISQLKANKPLVISLCSAIIDKTKDKFADKECGNHAMSITGVQCKDGKMKYLMQNSWGSNSKAKNEQIETVEGKGAYWFDEKTFYDSVYELSSIK